MVSIMNILPSGAEPLMVNVRQTGGSPEVHSPWTSVPEWKRGLNTELLESLRSEPLADTSDVTAAERLLELTWSELEAFGTGGGNECDDKEIAVAIRTLEAVTRRLGIPLELPFRDFARFKTYWLRNDGYGSWQARRDILEDLLGPTRKELETLGLRLTGPKIKEELISALRNPIAIRDQLGRLQRTAESDPALAIGTAKELIEHRQDGATRAGPRSQRQRRSTSPGEAGAGSARVAPLVSPARA
jgi:hypothetical protein